MKIILWSTIPHHPVSPSLAPSHASANLFKGICISILYTIYASGYQRQGGGNDKLESKKTTFFGHEKTIKDAGLQLSTHRWNWEPSTKTLGPLLWARKQSSKLSVWVAPGFSPYPLPPPLRPKNLKPHSSTSKALTTVFWDAKGVILFDLYQRAVH